MFFLFSVLAHLHPVEENADTTSKYVEYMDTLNVQGIEFPMKSTDVKKSKN
jgi:hypothetical protein